MRKATTTTSSPKLLLRVNDLPSENVNTIRSRKWRLADSERVLAYQRAWRTKHRKRRLQVEAAWRAKNRQKCRQYQHQFRERHKQRIEVARLHKTYGLPLDQAITHLRTPVGCCPICHRQQRLVIDHHHSTGLIRGRLCRSCNLLIGHADENIDRLTCAAQYLAQWQSHG